MASFGLLVRLAAIAVGCFANARATTGESFSLVQTRAQFHASAGEREMPPLIDISGDLSTINDTVDAIVEVIALVNTTAMDALTTISAPAAALTDVLSAASAAASLIPADPFADPTSDDGLTAIIDDINASVAKFMITITELPATINASLWQLETTTVTAANTVSAAFLDVQTQLNSLFNQTDDEATLRRIRKILKKGRSGQHKAAHDKHAGHKASHKASPLSLAEESTVSMLYARARRGAVSSNEGGLDVAVSGKGSTIGPCTQASNAIESANNSIAQLLAAVADVNATGPPLLISLSEATQDGLDQLNASIQGTLASGAVTLPEPIQSGVDAMIALGATVNATVEAANAEIATQSAAAAETAGPLYALADTLMQMLNEFWVTPEAIIAGCNPAPPDVVALINGTVGI